MSCVQKQTNFKKDIKSRPSIWCTRHENVFKFYWKLFSSREGISKKKYKTLQEHSVSIDKGKKIEVTNCVQESKEKQFETSTGCEGNYDTSPCNNTSTHNSDEAGPSEKGANTFGLEHDNKDAVTAWASELESSLHPTLGKKKDDPVQTGLTKTSGNSPTCQVSLYLALGLA